MHAQRFIIDVTAGARGDLAERLARARFAPRVLADGSGGMGGAELAQFVRFWAQEFEWDAFTAELAGLESRLVTVGDARVHVLRTPVRTARPPLVLLHGWPGSPIEFLDLLPRLTHPQRFGGDPVEAFDVIVPELPGFGWSTLPTGPVEPSRMAAVIADALAVLGVERYGLVGGDVGAHVLRFLAAAHPHRVVGVFTHHPALHADLSSGPPLSAAEERYLAGRSAPPGHDDTYAQLQERRPDTLAAALIDSPVGLAAWLLEKYRDWSGDGTLAGYDPARLAATVSWYWFSGSIGSSFRAYTDDRSTPPPPVVTVPAAITLTPEDADYPREYAARTYADIRQWRPPRTGGHFLALEDPQGLARDLLDHFGPLVERWHERWHER